MNGLLSFAETFVTVALYLFLIVGVVAVLMHATGLRQPPKHKPRHRAGDPPPQLWLERPPTDEERDRANRVIAVMRRVEAEGAQRLRRAMETSDD